MVRRELLETAVIVAVMLVVFVIGYAIHARGVPVPAFEGQVADAETGDGVSGAHLFRTVTLIDRLALLSGSVYQSQTVDWTSTDAEGRFHFGETRSPGVGGLRWRRDEGQSIDWVHRGYGWGYAGGIEVEAVIEIAPNAVQVRHLANPGTSISGRERIERQGLPCGASYNQEATRVCCEQAYEGRTGVPTRFCRRRREHAQ